MMLIAETPRAASDRHAFLVPPGAEISESCLSEFFTAVARESRGRNYYGAGRPVPQKLDDGTVREGFEAIALIGIDTEELPRSELKEEDLNAFLSKKLHDVGRVAIRISRESVQRTIVVETPELNDWLNDQRLGNLTPRDWANGPELQIGRHRDVDRTRRSSWFRAFLALAATSLVISGALFLLLGQHKRPSTSGNSKSGSPSNESVDDLLASLAKRWGCKREDVATEVNHAWNFDVPADRSVAVELGGLEAALASGPAPSKKVHERGGPAPQQEPSKGLREALEGLFGPSPNLFACLDHDLANQGGDDRRKADRNRCLSDLKKLSERWKGREKELREGLRLSFEHIKVLQQTCCNDYQDGLQRFAEKSNNKESKGGGEGTSEKEPFKYLSALIKVAKEPIIDLGSPDVPKIKRPVTPLFSRQDVLILEYCEALLSRLLGDKRVADGATGTERDLLKRIQLAVKASPKVHDEEQRANDWVLSWNSGNLTESIPPEQVVNPYVQLTGALSKIGELSEASSPKPSARKE